MKRKKIVIVGGGSNNWTPKIVKDMMLIDSLQSAEFVLYDINKQASDLTAAFLEKLNGIVQTRASFVSTDNRREAFENADYFVITISTGGFKAMAHDLSIPEDYSIFHTVGDTSGPGGWARTMRNFDVFVSLAQDINRYAKQAVVLNYSNPMTTLTTVLSRQCHGPVVGLCHGLFENLRFFKNYYNLKDENELSTKYAGLNHFFWTTGIRTKNIDVFADLKGHVAREGFTALLGKTLEEAESSALNRDLATVLFNKTGVMPYLGDRHTCEFFPCYITSKKTMKR